MIAKAYRNTLMFRWSITTAAVIALFWAGWYLVNGSVPVVTELPMTSTWSIPLPFAMSRWWDILIGPIWSVAFILLLPLVLKYTDDSDTIAALVIGSIFGFLAALVVGLGAGVGAGLGVGLIAALGVGSIVGFGTLWRWLTPKGDFTENSENKPGDGKKIGDNRVPKDVMNDNGKAGGKL